MANAMKMIELCMRHQIADREFPAFNNSRGVEHHGTAPVFSTTGDTGIDGVDRFNVTGVDDAVVNIVMPQENHGDV